MWGLRSEEALGRSLMDLDIGLPVKEIQNPINQLWDDKTNSPTSNLGPLHLQAVNRRGKPIQVRVILNKQVNLGLVPMGIVLLMEPEAI
jgi:two-component system CheB/CheR fusion protein